MTKKKQQQGSRRTQKAEAGRKIVAITQVSVDGVMQGPGGPEEDPTNGFNQGGWAGPYVDDTLDEVLVETVSGKFDLLLGRRTYEIFADYWPRQGNNPITKGYDRATKYVVTRSLDRLEWKNSERITGDVVQEVRRLKASEGPELHVWGSSQLLQTLIAADLIDEYRMWISPVVVGRGKRLFENGVPPRGLSLVETRSTPSGVLLNKYRQAGRLATADDRNSTKVTTPKKPNVKLKQLTEVLAGKWRVSGPEIAGEAEYRSVKGGRLLVGAVDFVKDGTKMKVIQQIAYDPATDTLRSRYLDTMGDDSSYTWELDGKKIRVSLGGKDSEAYFEATLNEDNSQYVGTWHDPDARDDDATAERIKYTRIRQAEER